MLRTLLIGLPEGWTDTPAAADGWRPCDVIGHLITGEQTDWMARTGRGSWPIAIGAAVLMTVSYVAARQIKETLPAG